MMSTPVHPISQFYAKNYITSSYSDHDLTNPKPSHKARFHTRKLYAKFHQGRSI